MSTPPQSHDLDEVATIPVLPGAGEQLRNAREAAGMSVHEISTHMHLDSRIILALEADDYDQLPAPTFVRGYLRGYARLLDLSPDPIIQAFVQRDLAPPSLIADISVKSQIRSGDFPIRFVTYIVIAALIVLVVLWWRSQDFAPVRFDAAFSSDPASSEPEPASFPEEAPASEPEAPPLSREAPALEAETAAPIAGDSSPLTAVPEPAVLPAGDDTQAVASTRSDSESELLADSDAPVGETRVLAADAGLAANGESGAEGGGAEDEATAIALPAENATPAPEEQSGAAAEAAPEADTQAASDPESDVEEVAGEASSDTLGTPEASETSDAFASIASAPEEESSLDSGAPADRLEMSFGVECWTEVYDHAEERLFYGLAEAGELLSLSGQGPIRVVLGNSDGVEVRYNGTPIEFASFVTRGVARFSVGGNPPAISLTPSPGSATASEAQPAGELLAEPRQDGGAEPAPAPAPAGG